MFLIWFNNIRKAKAMAIIMGAITGVFLFSTIVSWGLQNYKINSYTHVQAIVVDFDTRDSKNVWTEFEYSLNDKNYNVRLKGHSYWMRPDSHVALIVNPKELGQAEVLYDNPYISAIVTLAGSGIFGVFFLFLLLKYSALRKKERSFLVTVEIQEGSEYISCVESIKEEPYPPKS